MKHLWSPSTITAKTVHNREGQPLGTRPNDNLIPKVFLFSEKGNTKRELITMFPLKMEKLTVFRVALPLDLLIIINSPWAELVRTVRVLKGKPDLG
jgi:hypothetical protein